MAPNTVSSTITLTVHVYNCWYNITVTVHVQDCWYSITVTVHVQDYWYSVTVTVITINSGLTQCIVVAVQMFTNVYAILCQH